MEKRLISGDLAREGPERIRLHRLREDAGAATIATVMAACGPSAHRQRSVRVRQTSPSRAAARLTSCKWFASHLRRAPLSRSLNAVLPCSATTRTGPTARRVALARMLLVALLGLTFVLATVLAYEAHDAARSHRATAERALHDYAAFAAWELLAGVNDNVASTCRRRSRRSPPRGAHAIRSAAGPGVLVSSAGGALRCAARGTTHRASISRSTSATGRSRPPARRRRRRSAPWFADHDQHARTVYRPDWSYATVLVGRGAPQRALAYAVKYAEHGAPIAAFGFAPAPMRSAPRCSRRDGAPPAAAAHPRRPRAQRLVRHGHRVRARRATPSVNRDAAALTPFTADAPLEAFGGSPPAPPFARGPSSSSRSAQFRNPGLAAARPAGPHRRR